MTEAMPTIVERLADPLSRLVTYLREEADFNRSWTDGRRKRPGSDEEGYKARRIELAEEREAWAAEIERLQAELKKARELAIEECAGIAKYGAERAGRDFNESEAYGACEMANEIFEAIRALKGSTQTS